MKIYCGKCIYLVGRNQCSHVSNLKDNFCAPLSEYQETAEIRNYYNDCKDYREYRPREALAAQERLMEKYKQSFWSKLLGWL